MNKIWTPHLDNILRRYYPGGDLGALADRLGVTVAVDNEIARVKSILNSK